MGTLIYGGNIYTLQEEGHKVEALYLENSIIVDYGNRNKLLEKYKESIDEKMDLNGATLVPGFVDSHMHLVGHGEKLLRLDLSMCRSKKEALIKVKEYACQIKEGEWLIGDGWNENEWEVPISLTKQDLDEYIPNHPVLLNRICKHAMAVNTLALKKAGVTEGTEEPFGGVIEKDSEGHITGVFKDQAQELITKALPKKTDEYVENALRAAIKDAHRLGLTGAHTEDLFYYHGFEGTYRAFKKVVEEEKNIFRAHLLVHHEVFPDMIDTNTKILNDGEFIELGAMKIFADGAFGGRTALLSRPYEDDPTTEGVSIFTQEKLNELVKMAREHAFPVAVHAIGDAAFDMVLQAIENAPLKGNGRDRMIHATMLRKDLIDRLKGIPVILDIQPSFVTSDFPWVIDRLGKDNLDYCYAWKTLLEEGLHCAGGSDAPIETANPLIGIHAAVTRTNSADATGAGYIPKEALSVYEAVSLYTKGSAYAICHEEDRGMIEKGYLADFTVLDQNIFEINTNEIKNIQVVKTIIGNNVVFELANSFSNNL